MNLSNLSNHSIMIVSQFPYIIDPQNVMLLSFRDAIVLQIKLRSLILDLVHMLDVVRKLSQSGVSSVGDWLWQKQLRFYLVNKVG